MPNPIATGPGQLTSTTNGLHLLQMPREILQLICHHVEVDAFFVALQTCKAFAQAGRSRNLLLRQLGGIPGIRPGLEDLSTEVLLDEFLSRAKRNCVAAAVLADITLYSAFDGSSLARAVFSSTCREHQPRMAAVDGSDTMLVYELRRNSVTLKLKLWPSDCDMSVQDYEIVKITFTR